MSTNFKRISVLGLAAVLLLISACEMNYPGEKDQILEGEDIYSLSINQAPIIRSAGFEYSYFDYSLNEKISKPVPTGYKMVELNLTIANKTEKEQTFGQKSCMGDIFLKAGDKNYYSEEFYRYSGDYFTIHPNERIELLLHFSYPAGAELQCITLTGINIKTATWEIIYK